MPEITRVPLSSEPATDFLGAAAFLAVLVYPTTRNSRHEFVKACKAYVIKRAIRHGYPRNRIRQEFSRYLERRIGGRDAAWKAKHQPAEHYVNELYLSLIKLPCKSGVLVGAKDRFTYLSTSGIARSATRVRFCFKNASTPSSGWKKTRDTERAFALGHR